MPPSRSPPPPPPEAELSAAAVVDESVVLQLAGRVGAAIRKAAESRGDAAAEAEAICEGAAVWEGLPHATAAALMIEPEANALIRAAAAAVLAATAGDDEQRASSAAAPGSSTAAAAVALAEAASRVFAVALKHDAALGYKETASVRRACAAALRLAPGSAAARAVAAQLLRDANIENQHSSPARSGTLPAGGAAAVKERRERLDGALELAASAECCGVAAAPPGERSRLAGDDLSRCGGIGLLCVLLCEGPLASYSMLNTEWMEDYLLDPSGPAECSPEVQEEARAAIAAGVIEASIAALRTPNMAPPAAASGPSPSGAGGAGEPAAGAGEPAAGGEAVRLGQLRLGCSLDALAAMIRFDNGPHSRAGALGAVEAVIDVLRPAPAWLLGDSMYVPYHKAIFVLAVLGGSSANRKRGRAHGIAEVLQGIQRSPVAAAAVADSAGRLLSLYKQEDSTMGQVRCHMTCLVSRVLLSASRFSAGIRKFLSNCLVSKLWLAN